MFRIGEFARLGNVGVKALRHYDRIGLLRPAQVDPATGYRLYRADQLPRLNRILALRELGFGLAAIAGMLSDDAPHAGDQPADEAAYRQRERELIQTLDRTRGQLAALRARRALAREAAIGGPAPADVVLRPVPGPLVATLRGRPGADVGALFVQAERYVRSQHGRAGQPPLAVLGPDSVTVAIPLSWPIPPTDHVHVRQLPPVPTMACTVHRGSYAGLPDQLQGMLRWLDRMRLRPAGPPREVYLRFSAEPELDLPPDYLTDHTAELVTELQIPIATE